eukprot:2835495-Amphidinium_carterae.1
MGVPNPQGFAHQRQKCSNSRTHTHTDTSGRLGLAAAFSTVRMVINEPSFWPSTMHLMGRLFKRELQGCIFGGEV